MADNKISFALDLDVKEFTEKGLQAEGVVKKIGDGSNLSGLLSAFDRFLPILAAGTLAFEGFKKALDVTLQAEELDRVNKQFEILTKNAGIAPAQLKSGLEGAAKGLADTSDLMKLANEAIIKIGSSAQRLPELMTIATKASQVYGGTAKQNFELLSDAISNGNVKLLKRYGLSVDLQKAEREFAAAQGTTAETLSELGKRQAIFNAALDAGAKSFRDIEVNTGSATNTLQAIKTTFSDIGETVIIAVEKVIGPSIRKFLGWVNELGTSLKLNLQANIGEGAEAASAKLTLAQNKVKDIQEELDKLEAKKGTWRDFAPGETISRIQALNTELERQKTTVEELQVKAQEAQKLDDENAEKRTANLQKGSQEELVDREARAKQKAQFDAMVLKSEEELFNQKVNTIQRLEDVEGFSLKQRELLASQHAAKLQQISTSTHLSDVQKIKLKELEEKTYQSKVQQMELQTDAFRKKLLDKYVANSKSAHEGISRAFVANSQKMKMDQQDFGKRGEEMWNSLSSNSTAAFTQMGAQMAQGKDIGTAAADALKSVFLGMLGDRAIAEGSILLLSSIWPPNPLGLAAGSGLLALGGALKSLAGSSGGGTPSATAGGAPSPSAIASGGAAPLEPVSSAAVETQKTSAQDVLATQEQSTAQMETRQRSQRTVNVHIAGNYLETDQTRRALMDLMRQETDATGFSYNQIGA